MRAGPRSTLLRRSSSGNLPRQEPGAEPGSYATQVPCEGRIGVPRLFRKRGTMEHQLGDTKPAPADAKEYAKAQGLNPSFLHLRYGPRGEWDYVYGDRLSARSRRYVQRCPVGRDPQEWIDDLAAG